MWMIAAAILRSRLFWVAVAAFSIWAFGYHLGNKYGSNADAYRAVIAELRTKNAMLTAQLAEDAKIEREEMLRDAEADAAFSKAAPGLKKLTIDKKTADALNALAAE